MAAGLPTRTRHRILGARMIRRRHDDQQPDEERPSKGARKRASQELQELGEQLIDLPDPLFGSLPLPEKLRDAILAARRFTSHGAQLRQRQYIGKLMRKLDTEQIRAALEAHRQKENAANRQFKRIEQWRERLLRDPAALDELLAEHPGVDVPRLQKLVAIAGEESRHGSAPRTARELFHYLREILSASTV
jgi:ribosome-associated protein